MAARSVVGQPYKWEHGVGGRSSGPWQVGSTLATTWLASHLTDTEWVGKPAGGGASEKGPFCIAPHHLPESATPSTLAPSSDLSIMQGSRITVRVSAWPAPANAAARTRVRRRGSVGPRLGQVGLAVSRRPCASMLAQKYISSHLFLCRSPRLVLVNHFTSLS